MQSFRAFLGGIQFAVPCGDACLKLTAPGVAKLRNSAEESLDVLGSRQTVVAILYQRQHDVILCEARNQFDSVSPWHVRIGDPLQDAHRASGFDQPAEQKVAATICDEGRRY